MAITNQAVPEIKFAHRILVVDDYLPTANSIKVYLEERGFSVSVAKDGGQAHSEFAIAKPDVVVLDLILPGESGFEVCDRIKRIDEHIPVIVLSAIPMQKSKKLALSIGADAYMVKPCEPERLLQTINRISQRNWLQSRDSKPRRQTDDSRIHFDCKCGKRLKARLAHRGRTMICSDCGNKLIVPLRE